ncbi:MAG: hypothetical protein GXY48_03135 [Methanomicrobiales archaeon]|nr:hypothetical protein [Methanomicrobiales archaeon]
MADFVTKSTVKSAERVLASPFASKEAMNTIVSGIITDNPWNCTSYTSGGATLSPVQKSSEYYTGKVVYENNEGKQVGYVTVRAGTSGAFDTLISTVLANTAMASAMGGTASHDSSEDSFSVTLKCHTDTGELYNVAFKRDRVSISSFESDSILTTIETWADTVTALA